MYNVRSDNIRWDAKKKMWKLTNVLIRDVDSSREKVSQMDSMMLNLNFTPADLHKDYYLKDKLSTPELVKHIEMEELRGTEGLNTLRVERFRRSASWLVSIIHDGPEPPVRWSPG